MPRQNSFKLLRSKQESGERIHLEMRAKETASLLPALLLLLLLLSRFSRVRLCATPQTAAHQAPPSLGFSGKNTGVGCHFLLQYMKLKSESEVAQSCPTLSKDYYNGITEKAVAPHSSTLAWKIPWTEEPGRLQSMGSLRVGRD